MFVVLLRSSTWPSLHLHNSLTFADSSFFRPSIRSLGNFSSLKAASSNQFELIYLIRVHVFATFSLIHLRNQSSIMEINLIGLILKFQLVLDFRRIISSIFCDSPTAPASGQSDGTGTRSTVTETD